MQGDDKRSKVKEDNVVIKFIPTATRDEIETLIEEYQLVLKEEIALREKEVDRLLRN